jgi:sterol 3beta-glucosyltransferase
MNIGIFTYGTRGDLQPYVALALGLMVKGHKVTLSATEDFKDFVEGFGVKFQPLWGNAETMMNSKKDKTFCNRELNKINEVLFQSASR